DLPGRVFAVQADIRPVGHVLHAARGQDRLVEGRAAPQDEGARPLDRAAHVEGSGPRDVHHVPGLQDDVQLLAPIGDRGQVDRGHDLLGGVRGGGCARRGRGTAGLRDRSRGHPTDDVDVAVGIVGQPLGQGQGVRDAELPVQREHPTAADRPDDRHALAVVLVNEDRDLRIVHELRLEPRADLVLQLGGGTTRRLYLTHQRQRDRALHGHAHSELGQLIHLEDRELDQVARADRELGVPDRAGGARRDEPTVQGGDGTGSAIGPAGGRGTDHRRGQTRAAGLGGLGEDRHLIGGPGRPAGSAGGQRQGQSRDHGEPDAADARGNRHHTHLLIWGSHAHAGSYRGQLDKRHETFDRAPRYVRPRSYDQATTAERDEIGARRRGSTVVLTRGERARAERAPCAMRYPVRNPNAARLGKLGNFFTVYFFRRIIISTGCARLMVAFWML